MQSWTWMRRQMRGHRDTVDPESASPTDDIKKKATEVCFNPGRSFFRAGDQPVHALQAVR